MRSLKQCLAIVCVAAATMPAVAQTKNDALVVTGTDWMASSSAERKAFLVGVANMIMAEGAYAKKNNQAMPPVGAQITSATQTARLGEVEARITRWYETNPGKGSTPVMAVVWQDIVKGKR